MIFILNLAGCSNKFNECVELQKEEFRRRNPGASYSLINSKYRDFETSCSQFKGK
jgi:hypothetical protein